MSQSSTDATTAAYTELAIVRQLVRELLGAIGEPERARMELRLAERRLRVWFDSEARHTWSAPDQI